MGSYTPPPGVASVTSVNGQSGAVQLTAAQVGAVPQVVADTGWVALAGLNGTTNVYSYMPAQVRRLANGLVILDGVVSVPAGVAAQAPVLALPAWATPATSRRVFVNRALDVTSAGTVIIDAAVGSSPSVFGLNGITYDPSI